VKDALQNVCMQIPLFYCLSDLAVILAHLCWDVNLQVGLISAIGVLLVVSSKIWKDPMMCELYPVMS